MLSRKQKSKRNLEIWGIEPQTLPMRTEYSTTELYPRVGTSAARLASALVRQ